MYRKGRGQVIRFLFQAAILAFLVAGCIPAILPPTQLTAPESIRGNSGQYMSPYRADGSLAPWVNKAFAVKVGATAGAWAGRYAGQKLLEQVPFVGGFLGGKLGEAAGRAIAVQAAGGWDYIKETSDLSFNSVEDMAVYLYVRHSGDADYKNVLDAAFDIYPELKNTYMSALINASKKK